jgi:hypothetical protein
MSARRLQCAASGRVTCAGGLLGEAREAGLPQPVNKGWAKTMTLLETSIRQQSLQDVHRGRTQYLLQASEAVCLLAWW